MENIPGDQKNFWIIFNFFFNITFSQKFITMFMMKTFSWLPQNAHKETINVLSFSLINIMLSFLALPTSNISSSYTCIIIIKYTSEMLSYNELFSSDREIWFSELKKKIIFRLNVWDFLKLHINCVFLNEMFELKA